MNGDRNEQEQSESQFLSVYIFKHLDVEGIFSVGVYTMRLGKKRIFQPK